MRDGDTLVAWLREAATEIEKAHHILDDFDVPRSYVEEFRVHDGISFEQIEYTLAARINLLRGPCMCDTVEEGWRPCPPSLCELPKIGTRYEWPTQEILDWWKRWRRR